MQQTFDISGHPITVVRDNQEKSFVSRPLPFIHEADATFYLPMQEGIFIHRAEEYLSYLAQHYADIKKQSLLSIGAKAFKEGFWGKRMSEEPRMDLVWVKVLPTSYYENGVHLSFAFNDAERDPYTLWITSFKGIDLVDIQRQAW